MGSNYKVTYSVDLVFVIDATGSMGKMIQLVKSNALNFYNDLTEVMSEKGKEISRLRIRVVAFRDYIADGENAMMTTDFFELPKQSEDFRDCVQSIEADGGGDEPEDGLEALAYAIRSPWNTEGQKKRQVIVVWTDASTHELGFGKAGRHYPKNMAESLAELSEWWGDRQNPGYMDQNAKRLLLFAPDVQAWSSISDNWDNVLHFPSEAGNGLEEMDYKQILNTISNTI